ncbi:MAG TPA: PIN domain-containing protein [Candidatus Thermoplasmatota archaeon]
MTARSPRLDGPVVVDANVLFGALLRDGTTRHLLLYGGLALHTPSHIWSEFERNRTYLLKKSRATDAAFSLLLDSLRDRIADVPLTLIRERMEEATENLGSTGSLDAPYVAAALALGATLWTQDKELKRKAPVPVVSTADVVAALGVP